MFPAGTTGRLWKGFSPPKTEHSRRLKDRDNNKQYHRKFLVKENKYIPRIQVPLMP
jgi:hypothetical protein